jgi:hypothetical protein
MILRASVAQRSSTVRHASADAKKWFTTHPLPYLQRYQKRSHKLDSGSAVAGSINTHADAASVRWGSTHRERRVNTAMSLAIV